jgi:hypothetical protein
MILEAQGHVVRFLYAMSVALVDVYDGSVENAVPLKFAGVYAEPGWIEYIDTFALGAQPVFSCAMSQLLSSTGLSNMLGSITIARTRLKRPNRNRTRTSGAT